MNAMAYCKKCGAYIPDDLTACLACGYDDLAESQKNSTYSSGPAAAKKDQAKSSEKSNGSEKYKQVDSDFLRKQLEEQRRRQQENSKKWAETEYAQRQKAKEEQARNFTNTSGRSGSDVYQTIRRSMDGKLNNKVFAILSYFPGLFILQKLFCKDDAFAEYHANQGRNLTIVGLIATWLLNGWALPLWIYMIYKGVSNAESGKKKPLPYIGDWFKQFR